MVAPAGGKTAVDVATVAGVSRKAPIVGIAADDLTGANDSAVQFARTGWTARLALGDVAAEQGPGTAIAVVTDARAMEREPARNATREAVTTLLAVGVDHLYLKIDSTMRGSVAGQVAGALAAWSQIHPAALAIICPAYPAMGRTVKDGVLLVNGEPVAATAIGRDPVTQFAPARSLNSFRAACSSLWVRGRRMITPRRFCGRPGAAHACSSSTPAANRT